MTAQERKSKAAELIAAGKLTHEQIGKEVAVTRRTLSTWKAEAEFQALVAEFKNIWRERARTLGIADPDMRLRAANDEHKRLRAVITQRAKLMKKIPGGGNTGLLTVTYKMKSLGEGLGTEAVPEFRVDVGLLERLRELRDEVAIAKGEHKPKPVDPDEISLEESIETLLAGRKRAAEAAARRESARNQTDADAPAQAEEPEG